MRVSIFYLEISIFKKKKVIIFQKALYFLQFLS